jgi:hypothetical protein
MKKPLTHLVVLTMLAGSPSALGAVVVAFDYNVGVVGQQNNGPWALGNDFTVNTPITVTALGAFDSGSDGIFTSPVDVALYDADSGALVSQVVNFSTASPGVAIGGSRFKDLVVSLNLPAGFHGSIVGSNYGGAGGTEVNGNAFLQTPNWSLNTGGGAISLTTSGRYVSSTTSVFPTTLFLNGGNPLFAAGTFAFVPIPEPGEYAAWTGLALVSFGVWRRSRR